MLVDEGHAVAKLLSDLTGRIQVGAPHGAGEAVVGIVRDLDGLRCVLSAVHDSHGPEDLVAANVRLRVHVDQQSRLHEGAVAVDGLTTDADGGLTVLLRLGEALDDLVAGTDGGQRTDIGVLVVECADLHLADALLQRFDGAVVELVHDDQALRGVAGLAGVVHADLGELLQHPVQVLIVEHDEGVVAAQLQQGLLVVLAGGLRHGGTSLLGSGEGHTRHTLIRHKGIHLGAGGVHVDESILRQPGLLQQVLAGLGGQRADGCVLQDQGVAKQQVRRCPAGDLVVGEIPRHNAQNHAQGLLAHPGLLRALLGKLLICHELVGMLGVPGENVRNDVDLCLGPTGQLAHLAPDVFSQLLLVLLEQLRGLPQDVRALRDRSLTPLLACSGGAIQNCIAVGIIDAVELLFFLASTWILQCKSAHSSWLPDAFGRVSGRKQEPRPAV